MNSTHLALFVWMCANALQSIVGFSMHSSYWSRNIYKKVEVATTVSVVGVAVSPVRDGQTIWIIAAIAVGALLLVAWLACL